MSISVLTLLILVCISPVYALCMERNTEIIALVKNDTTLTLILRHSRTGTVWFYTSISNKTKTVHKIINKGLKTYV